MTGKGGKRRQEEDTVKLRKNWEGIAFPKENPERDKKYRAWVRTHPCCACGMTGETITDHHIRPLGTGIKCSDYETVPVCNFHHREVERSRDYFERKNNIDLKEEAERLREEWDEERRCL